MKKWVIEDWGFELTAIEGNAANCRLGIEKDTDLLFHMNVQTVCVLE